MPFIPPLVAAASAIGTAAASAGTLATVSAAASAVGAGVSFLGQRQQAQATKIAAQYNAKTARDQSAQESKVAQENALRAQDYGRKIIGAQRAAMGSSGLSGASGTPLARLGDAASAIQQEIVDLGYASALRQNSLMASADMTLYQGSQEASAIRRNSTMELAGNLFQAGTKFAGAAGFLTPPKVPPIQ